MSKKKATSELLYLYCVLDGVVDEKLGKIGIGGRGDEVYGRPFKDLTAIVSHTERHAFERSEENVLAHQRVIQKIFSKFPAVPLPFSTILEDERELDRFLREGYNDFRDKLEKLKEIIEPVDHTETDNGKELVEEALAQSFASAVRIRQLGDEVSKLRRTGATEEQERSDLRELASEVKALKQELQALKSLRESMTDAIEKSKQTALALPRSESVTASDIEDQIGKLRKELDSIKKMQSNVNVVAESAEETLKEIMKDAGIADNGKEQKRQKGGIAYA